MKFKKKSWSAKDPGRRLTNDSCSRMALNLCRTMESLEEEFPLLVIGRDRSDSVTQIV